MMADFERELDWDDEISKESEFTLLPEGDYKFTVVGFSRGRHNGSAKLPACNKAELELKVDDGKGNTGTILHNLFLHTKTEGMISAFLIAIGQKKHGEPTRPNWNTMVGAQGRCKVGVHEWVNDKCETMKSNQIKKFYDYEAPAASAPKFQAGKF